MFGKLAKKLAAAHGYPGGSGVNPRKLLPAGAAEVPGQPGRWRWVKRGGHADAALKALRGRLAAAGFVNGPEAPASGNSADGGVVWGGIRFVNAAGDTVDVSAHYGATAAQNRFAALFTPAAAETLAAVPEDVLGSLSPRPAGG